MKEEIKFISTVHETKSDYWYITVPSKHRKDLAEFVKHKKPIGVTLREVSF
jgi:hypothetical protein